MGGPAQQRQALENVRDIELTEYGLRREVWKMVYLSCRLLSSEKQRSTTNAHFGAACLLYNTLILLNTLSFSLDSSIHHFIIPPAAPVRFMIRR